MKRYFLLTSIFLLSSTIIFGQGNTTYDFLRIDVGARSAALGGSFITSTDDPNLIFYNPAGMATLSSTQLSVGYYKHLLDINAGYVSFGTAIPNFGSVGLGIIYINYGEFERTGEEGRNLGKFGAGEFTFTAGYADILLRKLNYGFNVKFIYSSIAEVHSSAAALDFGLQYFLIPDRIIIGASLLNFGTQIDPYVNTREDLPLDIKIGASIYPEHLPAVVMINLHKLNEEQDNFLTRFKQFSIGVEFTESPVVKLRFGYNNERRSELKLEQSAGLAGFSVGVGFAKDIVSIDYGYNSLGKIGAMHRISLGLRLD
ncbi:MAG: type IX secretion system protein PorQ [Bacteroidota bacterium]|nr:type IX secretion system protein PorQ [Bacteroidota bacterium]